MPYKDSQNLILESLEANFQLNYIQDGHITHLSHKEQDYCAQLINTIELVKEIITSKPPYFIEQKMLAGQTAYKPLPLVQRIIKQINQAHFLIHIDQYFSHHKKHPYFSLFLNKVKLFVDTGQDTEGKQAITDFIEGIQKEEKTEIVKQQLYSLHFIVEKNYKSLRCYINQLSALYPKLLMIKLDLHYNFAEIGAGSVPLKVDDYSKLILKPINSSQISLRPPSRRHLTDKIYQLFKYLKRVRIQYPLVKQHREHFFKQLNKQSFASQLVGYAWKLDYNQHKHYFYRVLLFFNRDMMSSDVITQLPTLLIDFWRNSITYNIGYGSGIAIDLSHLELKQYQYVIEKAMISLTKGNLYLRFTPLNLKDRTYDRGRILTKKAVQKKQTATIWHDL